tara:strand:+ start:260162 stop:260692 length:531 start_codon:yes stop_codon:yes gene_type:complete
MKNYLFIGMLFIGMLFVSAQSNIFMKIDGISGDASAADYRNTIELRSATLSGDRGSAARTGSARTRSSLKMAELGIGKLTDVATTKLLTSLSTGKMHKSVVISFVSGVRSNGEYLRYELDNVSVTSYSSSVVQGDQLPQEELTLNFEKIKVTHYRMTAQGTKVATGSFSYSNATGI